MKKYIFFLINSSIIFMTMLTLLFLCCSCENYLDTKNEEVIAAHDELTSVETLQATTASLYTQPWYYFHKRRYVYLGDARANNLCYSNTETNEYNAQASMNEDKESTSIQYAWSSLYNVITQADYIINDYAPYCVEQEVCTQEEANVYLGEARFMRALAYWFLAMYWHDVPIVDDPVTANYLAQPNSFEDVLQYAICDAEFAMSWLPTMPYAKGRVSKVSAWALLSRLYLTAGAWANGNHFSSDFQSRVLNSYYEGDVEYTSSLTLPEFYYAKAAYAARQAIALAPEAGYALMDDYEQIFRVQNNNCKEVLFALQTVAGNSSYGLGNDMQGAFCYDPCIDNNYGRAWNSWASYDFVYVATKRGGLSRTRGNIMPDGMTYDYLYHEMDTCSQMGQIWTVNRPNDLSPVKKQVVGGPLATDNIAFTGNSGFCTPMLRLSEVYLNLTEALMGLYGEEETTRDRVLEGVNIIRQRAFKTERAAGDYIGDYGTLGVFNLDSLLQERRMEFFIEGLYWPDIVRRSFMGEKHMKRMIDYMNNKVYEQEGDSIMGCHRLYKYGYTANKSNPARLGTVVLRVTNGAHIIYRPSRDCVHNVPEGSYCHASESGTADNLWSMIYPPSETMQNPNLSMAPVSYNFTEIINNKNEYHHE
ncbi:MAG: RagB/SusD family nutrient uptake outer membrane protein [Prevotella sp.]|nr:RagB/SusD family nutrient uptake outer membrane protein [Prevotella sp.]